MIKENAEAKAIGKKVKEFHVRFRTHIQEHKREYMIGAGGIATGGFAVALFKDRPLQIINTVAPVINNTPTFNNDNSSVVNFGGHMTKIVKCLETGEMWEKVTEAAKDTEVSITKMSRHLNGKKDHVNGLHYQIVGMGTV